jgi:hypothetical protein
VAVVFTDAFTVASDIGLTSYPSGSPDYGECLDGWALTVNAANDRVQTDNLGPLIARIVNAAVPTGDQKITCDIGWTTDYDSGYVGCRGDSTGNCYVIMRASTTTWELYRFDNRTYTLLNSYGVSTTDNSSGSVSLKATGTTTVALTPTIAGADRTTYNDSSANRKTSGTPCVALYRSSGTPWLDNVSVDDLQAGGNTYNLSISEAAAAADAMSAVAALLAAVNEAATALDALGGGLSIAGTISEVASATDAVDGQRAISLSVAESAAAADQVDAAAALVGGLIEGAAAADQVSATAVLVAGVAEAGNAQDATGLEGNAYALSIAETAAAADQVSAQLVAAAGVTETAAAGDQVTAQATLVGGVDEAAVAAEALTTQLEGVAGVVESAAAGDFYAATGGTAETPQTLPPRPAMKRIGGSMDQYP